MKQKSFMPILLLTIGLAAATAQAQIADPLEEIKTCARIAESAGRAACFEALGQRSLRQESVVEAPASTAPAKPIVVAAAPAPDTAKAPPSRGWRESEPSIHTSVTSCRKGPDDRWYFYMDGGEVWKQTTS